jgi:hypothetical protein
MITKQREQVRRLTAHASLADVALHQATKNAFLARYGRKGIAGDGYIQFYGLVSENVLMDMDEDARTTGLKLRYSQFNNTIKVEVS